MLFGRTLISNKWCPYCSGKRQTIANMHILAESRDGKCLSDKYIKAIVKLKWQCKEGHEWEASPSNIKRGSWCPICAKNKRKKKK